MIAGLHLSSDEFRLQCKRKLNSFVDEQLL
jgi:hypothetical protein